MTLSPFRVVVVAVIRAGSSEFPPAARKYAPLAGNNGQVPRIWNDEGERRRIGDRWRRKFASLWRENAEAPLGHDRLVRSPGRAVLAALSSRGWAGPVLIQDVDDDALMKRVAKGDESAFRALADRHLGRMLRLAEKTLGSAAEADDVTQEALLRIWAHAGRWQKERSRLTTWIYTIVYRLCIDRLRGQRTVPLDLAMDVPDPTPGAQDALSQSEDVTRLTAAIHALPPRQRAALTLFYYEEVSGEEAAGILGVSLRAFWSLLHRSRQAVQSLMDNPAFFAKAPPR
jgi:RNA polymerase sigma-70 factor (ECF subfamily)